MSLLAITRGLAIAASFFTAGSLAHSSLSGIPSILATADDDEVTAQAVAKQFSVGYRLGKVTQLPAELLSIIAFGGLAYHARSSITDTLTWKLYSAAALSMLSVVPWTLLTMEHDSMKIVALAESGVSHEQDKEPKLEHGYSLAVPTTSTAVITPVEEFEPYEDSPFSGAEYEKLKVRSLLQMWSTRNLVRVLSAALAGGLALGASTTRVTLVTIVQGR